MRAIYVKALLQKKRSTWIQSYFHKSVRKMIGEEKRKGKIEEEEVQFLFHVQPDPIRCQLCSSDLTNQSPRKRQEHYQIHFGVEGEAPTPGSSKTPHRGSGYPPSSATSSKKHGFFKPRGFRNRESDTFWHSAQAEPPPENCTPDLIPLLRSQLVKSQSTQRAWLCFEGVVHVTVEAWDRRWGCGYRNFAMVCSALMIQPSQPMYFPLLDAPIPPSVRNLQIWIENAWRSGFDPEGASQLQHTLFDTNKWIGTADIYVAFTSRGIPVQLADFDLEKTSVDVLLAWIEEYFSRGSSNNVRDVYEALHGASPIVVTKKMPMILQHAGHSRTIIGYERCNDSINLLIFDPSRRVPSKIRDAAIASRLSGVPILAGGQSSGAAHPTARPKPLVVNMDENKDNQTWGRPAKFCRNGPDADHILKFVRVPGRSLSKKRYQILYFPLTDPLSDEEILNGRTVNSFKIC